MSLNIQKHHKRLLQNNDVVVYTAAPDSWKKLYYQRNRWYKGGFLNTLKYKTMLFNKQYGDFGLLQFPAFLIMGWLVLLLIVTGTIRTLGNLYDFFVNFAAINYDFLYFFKFSGVRWFSLEFTNLLLLLFATSILFLLLFSSLKHHNEKLFKKGWFLLPMYLIVYGLFITFVWLGVLLDMVRGKTQKW